MRMPRYNIENSLDKYIKKQRQLKRKSCIKKMLHNGRKQFVTKLEMLSLQASILDYEPQIQKRRVIGLTVPWL